MAFTGGGLNALLPEAGKRRMGSRTTEPACPSAVSSFSSPVPPDFALGRQPERLRRHLTWNQVAEMAPSMLLGEQCRLCLQFVPKLRNSHIIPEFFYKLIYDAKHQFNVFSDTDSPPGRLEQKGLREYLLCGDCEQKLGRWEKYVKELLFDEAPQGIDRGDRMEYLGVDYA